MLQNLRYALRTLSHYRFYSVVNIVGLALSLACTIILVKYIFRESTVNNFITDLDNVYYQTMDDKRHPLQMHGCRTVDVNGRRIELADELGVEALTEMMIKTGTAQFSDRTDTLNSVRVILADSNLLKVINFPLKYGDAGTALAAPGQAIVSEDFARRAWGDSNPIGQSFMAAGNECTVVAVAATTPTVSSLEFEVIVNSKPDKESFG